jgi:copper chaperone
MEKIIFQINGMSCGHCKNAVEQMFKEAQGVHNASVDLVNAKAEVEFDVTKTSSNALKQLINESGVYQAS